MEANTEKHRLDRKVDTKTPEYRAERAKALKLACREEVVKKDVIAVDESTELQFKDEEASRNWEQWVKANSKDEYSLAVVTYARRFGKYMQHLMEKHNKTVVDIAKNEMYQSKGTSPFYNKYFYLSLTIALHSSVTLFIILLNTSVTSSSLNVLSALLKVIV